MNVKDKCHQFLQYFKKIFHKDANKLVRRLLQAIVINDDLVTDDETDYRSVANETEPEPDSEHETEEDDDLYCINCE